MNELEEKLNKMIDAVSEFAKVYLRERLNISEKENNTTENKKKVVVEVFAKPENSNQCSNILPVKNEEVKYTMRNGRLFKGKVLAVIKDIHKENPNITKFKLIQELARRIKTPLSCVAYNHYIPTGFYTSGATQHTNKRFNDEMIDDIICLNRIGFNAYYISVALGISPESAKAVCKRGSHKIYMLDRQRAAFSKNPDYLYNVAESCNIDISRLLKKSQEPVEKDITSIQEVSTKNPEIIKEVQTIKELFKLGKTLKDIINETGLQEYFVQGVLDGTLYSDITLNQSA